MKTLLNSGDVLNSRYRILHQLGYGGFGRTYLAEDLNRFNEYCVLKEFAPQLQESFALAKAYELFEREAGALYRLQHPQIPKFRELFQYQHKNKGHLLLVQDYVAGQTYRSLFNLHADRKTRFNEAQIDCLLRQMLPVLKYIHSLGIIHRDISPENLILRTVDGLPILIDFGSIKEMEQKAQCQVIEALPDTEALSLMGTVIGKNGYAPPEQIERGVVFAHSDLYALAATAVVLLTGKTAKQLIDPDNYCWKWQSEAAISPKLASVLTTMLAPNPGDRFSNATEVIKNLNPDSGLIFPLKRRKTAIAPAKSKKPKFSIKEFYFSASWQLMTAAMLLTISVASIGWIKSKNLATVAIPNFQTSPQIKSKLESRFSQGEKLLIPQVTTSAKEPAIAAFAQGNYQQAASLFSQSLTTNANDPEALIYLNNAQIGLKKSYSIAVPVPIGSDVNAAQEILRGVAQAQHILNQQGGFSGIPLKVQIINDDNNPEIARQVAQILSQDSNILGVIGHYASDVTLATAKIYQSSRLVSISPISTSIELSNLSPYLFRTVPSDYIAARALAEYMLNTLNQKNVAIFHSSQSSYSQSLKSEFMAAVTLGGGRVTNTFDLSDANFSATDNLLQAIEAEAEVIMLAANTDSLDRALQVIQVNRHRLNLLGGDDVYTPKTLQVARDSAKDMVIAIPWHIKSSPDNEFAQTTKKLWQGEVNWRTAMAYDAAMSIIKAIKLSPHPNRIGLQKTLANPSFNASGADLPVSFLPSGDRLKPIELVKVYLSSDNSSGYNFVPISDQRHED